MKFFRLLIPLFFIVAVSIIFAKDPDKPEILEGTKTLIAKNLKLVVWDDSGRFNLFTFTESRWSPLFFNDYPSTNFIRIYIDNVDIGFGLGGRGAKSRCYIEDDTVVYTWSEPRVNIKMKYHFIKIDSDLYDTLKITFEIENTSSRIIKVSGLFCFDTFLGEDTDAHFLLPGDLAIRSETEFKSNAIPSFISSYGNVPDERLLMHFDSKSADKPYRVFFANWKKVSEFMGLYNSKDGDSFSWGRYSFNDSALFVEYRDVSIDIDKSMTREFLIQNKNINLEEKIIQPVIVERMEIEEEPTILIEEEVAKVIIPDNDVQEDLTSYFDYDNLSIDELLRLLDTINKKLDLGEELSQQDIEQVDKIIQAIDAKSSAN